MEACVLSYAEDGLSAEGCLIRLLNAVAKPHERQDNSIDLSLQFVHFFFGVSTLHLHCIRVRSASLIVFLFDLPMSVTSTSPTSIESVFSIVTSASGTFFSTSSTADVILSAIQKVLRVDARLPKHTISNSCQCKWYTISSLIFCAQKNHVYVVWLRNSPAVFSPQR